MHKKVVLPKHTCHFHVLGSEGTGKSILLGQMLYQDMVQMPRGCGALIIDSKADKKILDRLKRLCRSAGTNKNQKPENRLLKLLKTMTRAFALSRKDTLC